MKVAIPITGAVVLSKKEAWNGYGVHPNTFASRLGLFLLKKRTFENISSTLEMRTEIRNTVVDEIKRVMRLDEKGRASGAAAEKFCQMNGLDIDRAEFFMVNRVPGNALETIAFSLCHYDKTTDIAAVSVDLNGSRSDNILLHLSKDNNGLPFFERFGNSDGNGIIADGKLKPEIKNRLAEAIRVNLKNGFVAAHDLLPHKPMDHGVFAINHILYP